MTTGWNATLMNDVCDITSSKRIYRAEYQEKGVPFYRGKEIIERQGGALDVSTELFISEDKYQQIKMKFGVPMAGELLLTSVGTLGIPYVVQPGDRFYFKDGNLTWFRNLRNIDPKFLYYWLLSPSGKAQLRRSTIGSSQSAFTIVLLKQMEVLLPPLLLQQKIAAILSTYDDLIENNLRRIKILDEMAQNTYREWFVKFYFPGYGQVRMVDSPLGKIPEGWEVMKLGEIAEEVRRGIPKGELNEITPYVGLEHIPRKSLALDAWEEVAELGSNKLIFEPGEILFGKIRPYFHKVSVAPFRGICSADTIVIRSLSEEDSALVTACVSSEEFVAHASATSNGAKMPRANWKVLIEYPVLRPTTDLLKKFSRVFDDMIIQQQNLVQKNVVLRQTRDILLPKLISGELDVSGLEIDTKQEEAA